MKLFKYKEYSNNTSNITYKYLMLSLFSAVICASLLCLTSYAWFTSTTVTSVSSVKAATYKLSYTVKIGENESDPIEFSYREPKTYEVTTDDTITIKLSISENSASTGYCVIEIDGTPYYTELISVNNDDDNDYDYLFTISNASGKTITFTSYWGQISEDTDGTEETQRKTIENNDSIDFNIVSLTNEEEGIAVTAEQETVNDTVIGEDTDTEKESTTVTPPDNNTDSDGAHTPTENKDSIVTNNATPNVPTDDTTNTDTDPSNDSSDTGSQETTNGNGEQIENNESEKSNEESNETDGEDAE